MTVHKTTNDHISEDVTGDSVVESFPREGVTTDSSRIQRISLPAQPAETVPPNAVLGPKLAEEYPQALYSHQAKALDELEAGQNVTVTTSTASGKTHVYALQIARNLINAGVLNPDGTRAAEGNEASTALCVFPTKALTNDQQKGLDELYDTLGLDIRVRSYDGDTTADRRSIRETADVILTNFVGLNVYLGHHDRWSRFYSALDLVAIDESHSYTGIEGMHVAWILRRMQRVASYWGSDPQYVLTSATIGNPQHHSEQLLDQPVTVIDDDGSPQGPRDIVLWNPPPSDSGAEGNDNTSAGERSGTATLEEGSETDTPEERSVADRVPASVEAPKVFDHLTTSSVQSLLFCPSRKLTELSIKRADDHYRANRRPSGDDPLGEREAYHAGLGRRTRKRREKQFKAGTLSGLATTSALELGIDIGDLDASVLMGYPGQRQAFWQRIGRAGRGTENSLAVLVGDHRTLDQYVMQNPSYLLENDVEDAVVDVSNDSIFADHVRCAADEIALEKTDVDAFASANRLRNAVEMWRKAGQLDGRLDTGVHYRGPPRPQSRINVYGTGDTDYKLELADDVQTTDSDRTLDLEPVDRNRAYRDYHEGAVRLQDGEQFEVTTLDERRKQPRIQLRPVDVSYYTRSRSTVTVLDAESERSRERNGFTLHYGHGTVLVHHYAYDEKSIATGETRRAEIETGVDPIEIRTQLMWVEVPQTVETALIRKYQDYGVETGVDPDETDPAHLGYIAGLHAAEHATIKTAPLELRVDKNDIGGLSTLVMDAHYAKADSEDGWAGTSIEAARRALEQRHRDEAGQTASGWFIYDGVDGGMGFARAIYEQFEALATRARDQLRDCSCGRPNGCPACTFDENCGNDNNPLLRPAAVDVLDQFLGANDPDALDPYLQDEPDQPGRRPVVFYS